MAGWNWINSHIDSRDSSFYANICFLNLVLVGLGEEVISIGGIRSQRCCLILFRFPVSGSIKPVSLQHYRERNLFPSFLWHWVHIQLWFRWDHVHAFFGSLLDYRCNVLWKELHACIWKYELRVQTSRAISKDLQRFANRHWATCSSVCRSVEA